MDFETFRQLYIKNATEGEIGEAICKIELETYFGVTLNKTPKNFVFDFKDNNGTYYEIKSRNNYHNKYPTTMVGHNKLLFADRLNKPVYFVFKFTDGIYYYEYDKSKINELQISKGGRCDRGKQEYKQYAYIPIELLKKIDSKSPPSSPSVLRIYKNGILTEEIKENELIEKMI